MIARKLQVIFEKFNLMGKLYATVFDGGANLRTAKNELRRMHANQVACVALQLPVLYFTTCLAHLVNSACNGAVLLAKREKFLVSAQLHIVVCANGRDAALVGMCLQKSLSPVYSVCLGVQHQQDPREVAVMHYVDEEKLQRLGGLQGCLFQIRRKGGNVHHTCEDQVH